MTGPRVLILGCGGIGGNLLAGLTSIKANVSARTRNQEVVELAATGKLAFTDGSETRQFGANVFQDIPQGTQYDYIFLATQPPGVEESVKYGLPALADEGKFVVFQNGLCEERVAAIAGPERVIGAIVSWGAAMPEPGHFHRTAQGAFTIGRFDGQLDASVYNLVPLLESVAPVSTTENLRGARWSKLALNCAISSLGTIAGKRLGQLLRVRRFRRLALFVMTEVAEVANAAGVTLEKVAGTVDLNWLSLTDREKRGPTPQLAAKHALMLAVGMRYRKLRSSMLSAIERGDEPAVDFLNGEVVKHAKALGLEAPINEEIVDVIWDISRGNKQSSQRELLKLYFFAKGIHKDE